MKLFLLMFVSITAHAGNCELPAAQVLENSSGHYLAKWDFATAEILSEKSLPEAPALQNFQNEVSAALDTSPYKLLDRYAERRVLPGDLYNLEVIASKRAGVIHKITCLESLLLDFQLIRGGEAREFVAFFLRRQGGARVYFFTNDAEGVRNLDSLIARVRLDEKNDWSVVGNLHNHTFKLSELESDLPQGVLSPSTADMQLFRASAKEFDLTAASITNGFHTVRIKADDFSKFRE